MTKNTLHKTLLRLVDIKPGEIPNALLMFFYFFLITCSVYIIKPVKISNFLESLNAEHLPFAYLITAILIGFVVSLNTKLLHAMKRNVYISLSLVFFISNIVLFWFFFHWEWNWLSMIYWVWCDIFTITTVTQFWILVNDIYHPRQARRLIGFLVSGGLLGGIAGSLLARFFAQVLGTTDLLLICPFLLFPCILIVSILHRQTQDPLDDKKRKTTSTEASKTGYIESFGIIKKSRYLLILSAIMTTAIIITTMVDFQFNSVIELALVDQDERTAFLGTFFTGLLVFSYLVHVFLTNRILKNFGMRLALSIAPLFLLTASIAILFIPASFFLIWAIAIKGGEKSLAHSLNQSVRELLYIPIAPEIKYKAKVFIDMFVNKFAKGIAASILLVCIFIFHFSLEHISLIVIGFSLLWIFLNRWITREYVGNVKRNLKIKWQDADKFISETVDIDMTKLVFDTLQSKDRSSVLYAMNLFDLIKREKMSPELSSIIAHKSDQIQACAMDSLLELDGELLLPKDDDTLYREDLSTQIQEIMSQDVYQQVLKEQLDKIVDEKGEEGEVSRMEAAKVLGMMESSSPVASELNKLLKDKSPDVLRYAIESAGRLKRREFVPRLIAHLSTPRVDSISSKALVAYGNKITGILKDYLSDPDVNLQTRRAIPDILEQVGTQRATDLLASELKKKENDVETEIIEALYKMRTRYPQIQFPQKPVFEKTIQIIKRCYFVLLEMHDLMTDQRKDNLVSDMEKNLARSLKHIFELLSLVYTPDDIIKAYQNICTGTKKSIDYSIELLDNILQREVKEVLLPLIDDISFEDRVRKCKKMIKPLEKVKFS
ncbi:MAG: MFS transporter [Candidatus Aminicenantes bacterium]|nr:MFS transporter [Candidatus Aminicenantes bacterium]